MSDVVYVGRKDAEMIQRIMASALAVATPAVDQTIRIPVMPPLFRLGKSSYNQLVGVTKPLVECVERAIQRSKQDFTVYEGLRTLARQKQLFAKGATRTLKSKHNIGFAVDLVPWIDGKPVWDWPGCARIAHAMDVAATQLGFAANIRWGGAWDRVLSDFGGEESAYLAEVEKYKQRHDGSDFIDGPHFEWVA